MTNAKSTLAVTAVILGGLVAASPFPYPREPEARPQRAVQAVAPDLDAPVAWTDPPARAESPVVVKAAMVEETPAPVLAAATVPAAAEKPAETAAKPAPRRVEQAKEQAKRRRLAQARARKAAEKQAAAAGPEREVASAAPAAAPFDPVTSLLKGLGFGRQG